MNVGLKRMITLLAILLIPACSVTNRDITALTPEFSHALPDRVVQRKPVLQPFIQPVEVYFASDSDVLAADENQKLVDFMQQFSGLAWRPLMIEGHTDSNHDKSYNSSLAKRRAQSVAKALVHLGYPAGQLTEIAWGEAKPIASNATASGRQLNRRALIKVNREIDESNR